MVKMPESSTQDCISSLPDSVLLYILSFLNTEEVVRTSVLSKRWQYMWTSLPTLTFVCPTANDDFVTRVNIALLRFQQTCIEKFKIEFPIYTKNCFYYEIDNWAQFAANKKVRDLSFHFNFDCSYRLAQSVCCNSSLTNLSLRGCYFPHEAAINWPSLKSLSLEDVEDVPLDTDRNILCGCPMLEYLKMIDCSETDIHIESKTLREVVIGIKSLDELIISLLKISAPNLRFLHLNHLLCDQLELVDVSSLVRATLNFTHSVYWNYGDFKKNYENLMGFLESICHVKELRLGVYFLQSLSEAMFLSGTSSLTSEFSCLTSLELGLDHGKLEGPGIIALLKCSPNLETLVVFPSSGSDTTEDFIEQAKEYWYNNEWRNKKKRGEFLLPHLKTVEFLGFMTLQIVDKYVLRVIQFLLENSGHLGRITLGGGEFQMSVMPLKHGKDPEKT